MKLIDGIPIWDAPYEGAVSQIKTRAKTADRVAELPVITERALRVL
jgi:hypothetical protein